MVLISLKNYRKSALRIFKWLVVVFLLSTNPLWAPFNFESYKSLRSRQLLLYGLALKPSQEDLAGVRLRKVPTHIKQYIGFPTEDEALLLMVTPTLPAPTQRHFGDDDDDS